MNPVQAIRCLLEDPEARVLIVIDSSGSVVGSSLHEEMFTCLRLARRDLDPAARRSMMITDSFCQSGEIQEPVPLSTDAGVAEDIPDSQMRGSGGGEHALVAIAKTRLFQHYAPTHLVYAGDLMDRVPKPHEMALSPSQNLLLLWAPSEQGLRDARDRYAPVGQVERLFYPGEAQALALDQSTTTPLSCRARPRM